MSTETEYHDQLPEALAERLRAHEQRIAVLTPAVDQAIETAARAHFPAVPRSAAAPRWRVPLATAAAVALLAVVVFRAFEPGGPQAPALADDIDRSGRVDILDAFALARVRAADPDAVSQERIDALADRVVALDLPGAVL